MKTITTDPVIIKNPAAILSFYLKNGGNGKPHWQSMDKVRMLEIMSYIQPRLASDFQATECQKIINQLNQN